MRPRKDLLGLAVLLVFGSTSSLAFAEEFHSKLSLRTANGLLLNQGLGGSTFSLGGLDLSYAYHVAPDVAFGLNYQAEFDFTKHTSPLNGFGIFWRWYFSGSGVPEKEDSSTLATVTRGLAAFYTGLELARKEYFLGSNPVDTPSLDQTGSFMAINALLGVDMAITHNVDFNVEANGTLLAFAGSDNRFFVRSYMVLMGISYVW
ncbi:MAG TPA: hypothetical protein VL588_08200 [Bdellovibrionota bacterium]|jgi:hypothetical protein|nr:hypothetical protein [Bdellovibrionota bacterium]